MGGRTRESTASPSVAGRIIMKRIATSTVVGLVLALLVVGCAGGVVDAGPVQTDPGTAAPAEPDAEPPASETEPDVEPAPRTEEPSAAETETETSTDNASNDEVATTKIRLYFLAGGGETDGRAGPFLVSVQREIPSTPRIALATLRELVDGPNASDQSMIDGVSTAVPGSTLVIDVAIDNRLATVNLSREFESGGGSFTMFARLAQVVYTVTQFPTVDEVQFELDGRPVTVFSGEGIVLDQPVARGDYLDLLPTVFVDSPAAGAEVKGSLRATGMGAVFEATFQYRLEGADGTVLAEGFAMTDEGMGWGSFDLTIGFDVDETQAGSLTVWEYSAKDGSVQAERVTPLVLAP
jgi:germination protein M